jgi:hypothetical protein
MVERRLAVHVSARLLHLFFMAFTLVDTPDWMIKTWNFGTSTKEERLMATFN